MRIELFCTLPSPPKKTSKTKTKIKKNKEKKPSNQIKNKTKQNAKKNQRKIFLFIHNSRIDNKPVRLIDVHSV